MRLQKLNKDFFIRDTVQVAEELLSCYIVRRTPQGLIKAKIVETEAYLGVLDSCCHSFNHLYTERTKAMYARGGYLYVYFTYGMHYCLNIITEKEGCPEAVLIRALEPLEGIEQMKKNRNQTDLNNLCSGPSKLCQALKINKDFNTVDLIDNKDLFIQKNLDEKKEEMVIDARIGLSASKEACYWPLRFFIKNNPYVSVQKNIL